MHSPGRHSVQSNLGWRFFLKQLTLLAAGAITNRVIGLSVVSPQVQRCLEIKHFSSGRITSGHLPLVQTDNYNLSIMIIILEGANDV